LGGSFNGGSLTGAAAPAGAGGGVDGFWEGFSLTGI
jgi:hypothetical protein